MVKNIKSLYKKVINLSILILIALLFSCKKEPEYHKLSFELTIDVTTANYSFFDVSVTPYDYENNPKPVDRFNLPSKWKYDYFALKTGDKVIFSVLAQLYYKYEMRIYIDDVEVSYRKIITSPYNYYGVGILEQSGRNDLSNEQAAIIQFTY
jgi:hypothetical protein